MAIALQATPTAASDPPHWVGESVVIDCTSQCHVPHNSLGEGLTSQEGNSNLCLSCHNSAGLADGLSMTIAERAVPHVSGTSHAFDVAEVNAAAGAGTPTDTQMDLRTPGDTIVCSTCHDQHEASIGFGGTTRIGSAGKVLAAEPPGSGTLAAGGTYTGPEGVWYLIEIVATGSETTAEFCYSKDRGITWRPTGCDPPNLDYTPSQTASNSPAVTLDDLFGVDLTFAGGAADAFKLGERWEFSASYPFLRASFGTGGSTFCAYCHQDWVMTTADVRTYGGAKPVKSHPTGMTYEGTGDYHSKPLDGDGQTPPLFNTDLDGNPSNDLRVFGAGNSVECLTCHGIHFVDSNTETPDPVRGN